MQRTCLSEVTFCCPNKLSMPSKIFRTMQLLEYRKIMLPTEFRTLVERQVILVCDCGRDDNDMFFPLYVTKIQLVFIDHT